jgi:hypothetical protein
MRNVEWDAKFVANPRSEVSSEMEKALTINKAQVYMSLFPDLVNREEIAADIAEKFGDDPTRVLKSSIFQTEQPTPEMQGGQSGAVNQMTSPLTKSGGPMAASSNLVNSINNA